MCFAIGHWQCDHWQCDHSNGQDNNQNDQRQSLVNENSHPHMVGSAEAVDIGVSCELVASQSMVHPLLYDKQLVFNWMSFLSSVMHNGGQITSMSSSRVIIEMQGQTITILFTQDIGFFIRCSHNIHDKIPAHIARWREHLIALGIHSTPAMIDGVPTIIAFGNVSGTMLVCYTIYVY